MMQKQSVKGIILAGGSGTRLDPLTRVTSKQLMPVYDKPMIYYPLSVLMLAGIRDILIITTPNDLPQFQKLLGDGRSLGLSFSYAVQEKPNGLPEAFLVGRHFIEDSPCALILGDNIFYGHELPKILSKIEESEQGATVFAYNVQNPERYGIVTFNEKNQVISLEEKPKVPKSNYALTGLYFFDSRVVDFAEQLKPSARGELEIVDLMKCYLSLNQLNVKLLGRGIAWLDTGTHESLLEAGQFIHTLEKRQGLKIACPEEIAYRMGYIDGTQLMKLSESLKKSEYGSYLRKIVEEGNPVKSQKNIFDEALA